MFAGPFELTPFWIRQAAPSFKLLPSAVANRAPRGAQSHGEIVFYLVLSVALGWRTPPKLSTAFLSFSTTDRSEESQTPRLPGLGFPVNSFFHHADTRRSLRAAIRIVDKIF